MIFMEPEIDPGNIDVQKKISSPTRQRREGRDLLPKKQFQRRSQARAREYTLQRYRRSNLEIKETTTLSHPQPNA